MGTQVSKRASSTRRSPHPTSLRRYDLTNFAVITVLFNPFRSRTRYAWYRKLRDHIHRSGLKLLTVECIFDVENEFILPKQKFEVTRPKNSQNLQIRAPSVLWLKENLINLTVQNLPADIEYIAWIDTDIEFDNLDWPHLTIEKLQRYSFVQLFQRAFVCGAEGKKQVLHEEMSFVYAMQNGKKIDQTDPLSSHVQPGYAWAMRRQTFDQMGGLLEISILGGAEIHFAFALFGRIDQTIPVGLHPDYQRLTKVWANRLAQLSAYGYNVSYLPLDLYHYSPSNRGYRNNQERWSLLEEFQYSPLIHLEKHGQTGLIRLHKSSTKVFQDQILRYFKSREMDQSERRDPIINTAIKSSKPIISPNDVFLPTDDLMFHQHTSSIEDIYQRSRVPNHEDSENVMF